MALTTEVKVATPGGSDKGFQFNDAGDQTSIATGTGRSGNVLAWDKATNILSAGPASTTGGDTMQVKILDRFGNTGLLFYGPSQQLAIGNTTSTVTDASLALTDTGKALVLNRMTTAQKNAIGTPIPGMLVFDTTLNKLCIRGAASWETVTSV